MRDQIGKDEWARRNGIDPSFDLPIPANESKECHLDGNLQTLLIPDELERTLSAIRDQTRTALQETGVNTLYLALGYLEWCEAPDARAPLYAPILLHPVDIERKIVSGKYRYSIGSLGEETEINITLSERLHQDFHRFLPPLDEDDTPESYFSKVTEAIKGMPGWRVRRFAVVGHFAFARLVMFQDLDDPGWHGGIGVIGSQVIAELFAGHDRGTDAFFAEDYAVDEATVAAKVPFLITDADSSQFSAIVDVMDGKNLAIKGPPGTGKSQTITNIVAAALGSHKSVLFVAEKMAALNVVKDRLEKAGLGHFCLELHSTKARKKDLLESLQKRLEVQNQLRADGDLPATLKELGRIRDQLSDYVATINRSFGATGKTIHQILWSEQRTRLERQSLPKAIDDVEIRGAKEMTRHDVAALKTKAGMLAGAYADAAAAGSLEKHPWFGIGDATLDYFARERLVEDLKVFCGALHQLSGVLEAVGKQVHAPISDAIVDALNLSETLTGLPEPVPQIDHELYAGLVDPAALASLEAFQVQQAVWLDARRAMTESMLDPEAVVIRGAELQAVVRLADEVLLTDKPLRELAAEAELLAAKAHRVEQTIAFGRRLARAFMVDTPMTAIVVRKLLNAADLAASLSHDLRPLRHPGLFDQAASRVLLEGLARTQELQSKLTPLSERLEFGLRGQSREWRGHAQTLRTTGLFSSLWRSEVRAATSQYKSLMRVPGKVKRLEMAADFDALAECAELVGGLAYDASLQAVCGPHFRGHETPFERLIEVNDYAILVRQAYAAPGKIDIQVRHKLLEGSSEALAQIAALSEDSDAIVAEQTLGESRQ